jgi:flagellar biogenesis protein FliO
MAVLAAIAGLLAATTGAQTESHSVKTGNAASAGQEPTVLDDPWSAVAPDVPARESRPLKRRSTAGRPSVLAGKSENSGRPWMRTLGALAGVVGLIVLLAWGYRAIAGGSLPMIGNARRPGMIDVISKTSLSARQSLCLVKIGPRLVLIGQSQDSLRALDVIDDADLAAKLVGEAAQRRPDSSQAEFQDCLEREARGYREDERPVIEHVTPEASRIEDVRRGLTDTVQRIRRVVARA